MGAKQAVRKKQFSTQLNIIHIIKLLWAQKLLFVTIIFCATSFSVWHALHADEVYRAELKAVPSEFSLIPTDTSLQSTISLRLKGFYSASGEYEKHLVAVQTLQSRNFIYNFIQKYNLTPLIFAVDKWHPETNTLTWHQDLYNPVEETWVVPVPPTLQDATTLFILNHLMVMDDRKNRILSLQILHKSPVVAAQWATLLIEELNHYMQHKEVAALAEELSFYHQQLATTTNANTRNLLSKQIEETTYKSLIATAQNNYLFEVIDPPMVAERRAYPQRSLVVVLGTGLGGLLALLVCFMRALLFPPKNIRRELAHATSGI